MGIDMILTKEDVEFIQTILAHAPFTGIPDTLAQYLETYVRVMQKLEQMKEQPKEPEQMHLEGVGT